MLSIGPAPAAYPALDGGLTVEALRVFLSHAHQDKPFADALVHALRGGANVWYDEHNLGTGQLLDEITRELPARPVFVVLLSKAAFASTWVRQECRWAFNLYNREPGRIILPVTVGKIEPADFDAVLYLEDFKRVEAPGFQPYEWAEACTRTLRALTLTPAGAAPVPAVPQPAESLDDLLTQGKALIGKKQYAEAIPFFERATRLDQKNWEGWAYLGSAYNETKRNGDDVAAYERALALDGKQTWVWNNKGNAVRYLKRYDEALAAYDRALALDPKYAFAWNNKGIALRALGREAEAQEAERHARLRYGSARCVVWDQGVSRWGGGGMGRDGAGSPA